MAIGLPPVDVYLSSTFVGYTLPAASTEMSLPLGNTVLRVRGVRLLSTAAVGRALAGRLSLAAAADALADAYEGAGWRNVLVVVVDRPGEQIGEQMLVVHETGLSAVLGVDPLTVYFRPFIGPAPIRRSAFAIAARMAELHAGRTGADATALYQRSLEVPEKLTLRVGDDAPASPKLDYQLRLGNEGNRFVGRWFGGVAATATAASSARLGLGYDRVLPELGDARGKPRYDGYSLFTDRVTRHGLIRLLASRAGYRYRGIGADNTALGMSTLEPALKASDLHVGLQGERFIHMSPHWRWSLGAGAAYDRYRIRQLGTRASAAETHAALQVTSGLKWHAAECGGRPQAYVDLQAQQSLVTEFRGTGATDDFRIGGLSSGISTRLFGADRLSLTHELQWSQDALPQSEQWLLGGFDRLSAWLPGVAVGDRGTLTRLSYQVSLFSRPKHDLRLALSAERGTSRFVGRAPALDTALSSAGLALSYGYTGHWRIETGIGKPLERDAPAAFAVDRQEATFHIRALRAFAAE